MKKLIVLILLAALALSVAACSPINKNDVAVLWADGDTAVSPNSLINAMDRALYIENIAYTYYGAGGDEAKQLQQAEEALNANCAALMVELVNVDAAQSFVDLARSKNMPIIFFGTAVDTSIVAGYEKCVSIATNEEKLATQIDTMVSEYINDEKNSKTLDRNGDGVLDTIVSTSMEHAFDVSIVKLNILQGVVDPATVELIITDSDDKAMLHLMKLQEKDFNTDKLKTQYVGLFTVGNDYDVKGYVLSNAPEEAEARKAHLERKKFLVDLTTVAEEDLPGMIFTTVNMVDSGRITGTVMEDYDGIAEAAAAACAALLSGGTAESVLVDHAIYTG